MGRRQNLLRLYGQVQNLNHFPFPQNIPPSEHYEGPNGFKSLAQEAARLADR